MKTPPNNIYGYIRVSTVKQGHQGVSLQEQRAAMMAYAEHHGLQIVEWFEERVTAAKQGRPVFAMMLKRLARGDAGGVVIHKIDRGARNYHDWADISDLIDAGVAVHFANDNLDLHSRGGRLAADIQAVFATDFIRNLREETLKGMRGRLKQGLLPFGAPLGYVNTGKGSAKTIDPFTGPLVRQAFELYATGRYTLATLLAELHRRGLRNRRGHSIGINGLSRILNNPFYAGLIRISTTSETYKGIHVPLLKMTLFKQVQVRLTRRLWTRRWIHDFTFRGLFQCSLCKRNLIAETQKGHIYYRCQTIGCPTRGFREEVLEDAMLKAWAPIATTDDCRRTLLKAIDHVQAVDGESDIVRKATIQTHIGAVKDRLTRLIDAFLDGAIDKATFEERKRTLLEEQRSLEDSFRSEEPNQGDARATAVELLELASSPEQSYRLGNSASRREMAIRLCSNRSVAGKTVSVEPSIAFRTLAKRTSVPRCDPHQDRARTDDTIARELLAWASRECRRENDLTDGSQNNATKQSFRRTVP